MFRRKFAALLLVAAFVNSFALPSGANDFEKIMNKGLSVGKKEALKQVGRTIQKTAVSATSTHKTSTTAAETVTKTSNTSTNAAATSVTAASTTKTNSTAAKIKEKVAAEAQRNANKYANKYLQKGEGQLTKFLK